MLRFVITLATAAAFIAGADLANAGGGGAGALPAAQSTLDSPTDAYAYAQKTKKVSKGPRAQAAPVDFVVEPIRTFPKDELYEACQHPFKTAFSCPGGGM